MYFDWTIILIIPAMIFAMAASAKVKSTFRTYSSVGNRSGLTGARAARALPATTRMAIRTSIVRFILRILRLTAYVQ